MKKNRIKEVKGTLKGQTSEEQQRWGVGRVLRPRRGCKFSKGSHQAWDGPGSLWGEFVGKGRCRENRNLQIVHDFSVVSAPLTSGSNPEDLETRGFSKHCFPPF